MSAIDEKDMHTKIYKMALLLLNNYHDAWDLTQEVFLQLEKGRSKWEKADNKWAWACGVFHRQLKRFFRLRKTDEIAFIVEKADANASPREKAVLKEQLENTFAAIRQLNKEEAEALLLFSMEKMSIRDIAGIQNVAEGTVKWRIFEARRKVSQMVMKDE